MTREQMLRDLTATNATTVQHEPQTRGPEHARLDPLVGSWHTRGRAHRTPLSPEGDLEMKETYEWLPGEQFLVHRLDGMHGKEETSCIEIMWYDAASETYPMQTFYNNGTMNVWRAVEQNGGWLRAGEWTVKGSTLEVRCITRFADGGNTIDGRWEYSEDGVTWAPFWEVQSRRVTGKR